MDDGSEDGTSQVAQRIANETLDSARLTVLRTHSLPPLWVGKVWALSRGVSAVGPDSTFVLFTDADIVHPDGTVQALVTKALCEGLDLVSLMAHLRARSPLERLLIPAFVYFFGMLYPFRWTNDHQQRTAAAAGGCILMRWDALVRAGGVESIAAAIIDACALARRIKGCSREGGGRLWLGLSRQVHSVRNYSGLQGVWDMVARSACAQLGYSPWLLLGAVLGMLLVFVTPPSAVISGLLATTVAGESVPGVWLVATGVSAWTIMALTYRPMGAWYARSWLHARTLPAAAALYTIMTINSAWRRSGAVWKGRTYEGPARDARTGPTATDKP